LESGILNQSQRSKPAAQAAKELQEFLDELAEIRAKTKPVGNNDSVTK
jgi:hypothetical protein